MIFEKKGGEGSRYQLRYAAGLYWLLDMEQDKIPCKKPLAINSVGAYIWRQLEKGDMPEEIVDKLSEEYQTDRDAMRQDVSDFLRQLEEYGIM